MSFGPQNIKFDRKNEKTQTREIVVLAYSWQHEDMKFAASEIMEDLEIYNGRECYRFVEEEDLKAIFEKNPKAQIFRVTVTVKKISFNKEEL